MMKQSRNTFGKKKHRIVLWFVTSCLFILSCQEKTTIQRIAGETQGTTYQIILLDKKQSVTKANIDSILQNFDLSLSQYIPNSTVSLLNNSSVGDFHIPNNDFYFMECYNLASKICKKTEGIFDPTVLPLMELWGFLHQGKNLPSQREIDSVQEFIGFRNPALHSVTSKGKNIIITKNDSRLKFDFNAIAQGYSVDVLADYLQLKGYKNFFIEIGGEIFVSGHNPEGNFWRLGVDKPIISNDGKFKRVISAVIKLKNGGVATSGNYRKFYEKNGKIYAHTLNTKTGYPAENTMLSATVIAKSTAIADGMATAFMAMGLEKAKQYINSMDNDHLEVLFIYSGNDKKLDSFANQRMKARMDN